MLFLEFFYGFVDVVVLFHDGLDSHAFIVGVLGVVHVFVGFDDMLHVLVDVYGFGDDFLVGGDLVSEKVDEFLNENFQGFVFFFEFLDFFVGVSVTEKLVENLHVLCIQRFVETYL